jgi:hypothetical protein
LFSLVLRSTSSSETNSSTTFSVAMRRGLRMISVL